ncbi:MAG: hypothetical protein ACK4M7_06480, partial [Burkholderiales bacterium]
MIRTGYLAKQIQIGKYTKTDPEVKQYHLNYLKQYLKNFVQGEIELTQLEDFERQIFIQQCQKACQLAIQVWQEQATNNGQLTFSNLVEYAGLKHELAKKLFYSLIGCEGSVQKGSPGQILYSLCNPRGIKDCAKELNLSFTNKIVEELLDFINQEFQIWLPPFEVEHNKPQSQLIKSNHDTLSSKINSISYEFPEDNTTVEFDLDDPEDISLTTVSQLIQPVFKVDENLIKDKKKFKQLLESLLAPNCKIRELNLSNLNLHKKNFFVKIIHVLQKNRSIFSLNLAGCNLKDSDLRPLLKLIRLTHLNLSGNQITAIGAKYIAPFTNLVNLNISNNKLGHKGTIPIGELIKLNILDIRFNGLEAEGVKPLVNLPELIMLNVQGNNLGNMGAWYIAEIE